MDARPIASRDSISRTDHLHNRRNYTMAISFRKNSYVPSGKRLTGFARYTEVLERNFKKFLFTNLLTLAGFLPFAAGAVYAVLSSSLDISIEPGICMCGEVGLSGEIRPVNRIEQRILEAEKLGFSRIIIPHNNLKGFDTSKCKMQIVQVRKVEEAFRQLFG